jgi:hypothetical protein
MSCVQALGVALINGTVEVTTTSTTARMARQHNAGHASTPCIVDMHSAAVTWPRIVRLHPAASGPVVDSLDCLLQVLTVVDKSARGVVSLQQIIPVRYVPLTLPEEDAPPLPRAE